VRDGHARNTARKRVDGHLTRAVHVVVVTGSKWSLMAVTAPCHRPGIHLDQRQSVDTLVDTDRFRPIAAPIIDSDLQEATGPVVSRAD
jgi:hypothetical protein